MKLILILSLLCIISCQKKPDAALPIPQDGIPALRNKIPPNSYSRLFETLDEKKLLIRLYGSTNFDVKGNVVWEPNYQEKRGFALSYDSKCHTGIDTIFYFNNTEGEESAVVVLGNRKYHKDKNDIDGIGFSDCHFCGVPIGIALFRKLPSNHWNLYAFEKRIMELGYFGTYQATCCDSSTISLRQMGDHWTCLVLRSSIGSQMGISFANETWFSIERKSLSLGYTEPLRSIFAYTYYYDELNMAENPVSHMEADLNLTKKLNAYYEINLKRTENGVDCVERYKYSDFAGSYVRMNDN